MLSIVGCGSTGAKIARGVLAAGGVTPARLALADTTHQSLSQLRLSFPSSFVTTSVADAVRMAPGTSDNNNTSHVATQRCTVVLAGDISDLVQLCAELRPVLTQTHIVVSLVEGATVSELQALLGPNCKNIARVTPTTDNEDAQHHHHHQATSAADLEEGNSNHTPLPTYLYNIHANRALRTTKDSTTVTVDSEQEQRVVDAVSSVFPRRKGQAVTDEGILDDVESAMQQQRRLAVVVPTVREAMVNSMVQSLTRTGMSSSVAYQMAVASATGMCHAKKPAKREAVVERLRIPEEFTARDLLM